MVKKSFAVIGLGQFGRAVVEELVANSADVIAIDNDEEIVKKVAQHTLPAADDFWPLFILMKCPQQCGGNCCSWRRY